MIFTVEAGPDYRGDDTLEDVPILSDAHLELREKHTMYLTNF